MCNNDECEGVMVTIKAQVSKISSRMSKKINFQDSLAFAGEQWSHALE